MQLQPRVPAQPPVAALEWRDDHLRILDQRSLPDALVWVECHDAAEAAAAIADGVVQGAVNAGLVAAYGIALAARRIGRSTDWAVDLQSDFERLAQACPASWVLGVLDDRLQRLRHQGGQVPEQLAQVAVNLQASDEESRRALGRLGVQIIRRHDRQPQTFMTLLGRHAGGSQTGALDVIRAAQGAGLVEQLYLCAEGAPDTCRLALWELGRDEVVTESHGTGAAGQLMRSDNVSWVVVGAHRIAANGDVINDIGTYSLAVLAMHHGLRFMVVAPSAAFDPALESADELDPDEGLLDVGGRLVMDVTPADLIDVIVTERGVVERPDESRIAELLSPRHLH